MGIVKSFLVVIFFSLIVAPIVGVALILLFVYLGMFSSFQSAVNSEIHISEVFLVLDLAISTVVMYILGYFQAKFVPDKEIIYGILWGSFCVVLYAVIYWEGGVFQILPYWYSIGGVTVSLPAVVIGSYCRKVWG